MAEWKRGGVMDADRGVVVAGAVSDFCAGNFREHTPQNTRTELPDPFRQSSFRKIRPGRIPILEFSPATADTTGTGASPIAIEPLNPWRSP